MAPGQTVTVTDTFVSLHSPADIESCSAAIPLERLAKPPDIADAIAFLASPEGHVSAGRREVSNGVTGGDQGP